jgi:type I restriction enzyme S subunit
MAGDVLPVEGYSKTSREIDSAYRRSKVDEGDIVVAIRATVGKCLLVPKELEGANLTQGTAKISPGPNFDGKYLLLYFSSSQVQKYLESIAKGSTFREITLDMLRRVSVLLPPRTEQRAISNKLLSLNESFNSLIAIASKQMSLLQERRTTLISAAVTGKIDVRNWQPPIETQADKDTP